MCRVVDTYWYPDNFVCLPINCMVKVQLGGWTKFCWNTQGILPETWQNWSLQRCQGAILNPSHVPSWLSEIQNISPCSPFVRVYLQTLKLQDNVLMMLPSICPLWFCVILYRKWYMKLTMLIWSCFNNKLLKFTWSIFSWVKYSFSMLGKLLSCN